MADRVSTAELRRTWEPAALGWAKWEEKFSEGLVEVTDALFDMAGIEPGMRVIDLACGAGSQSNLDGDGKGKGTSGSNREAESTDAPARGGLLRSSDEAG
jgi:hypothetical protein